MTARTQQNRTTTNNAPPGALLPGQIYAEMGTPFRVWVGVPTSIDASGRKLLSDSTVPGPYLPVAGGTMQGPVALTGNTTAITPAPGDNDTSVATTAFVSNHVTTALGGSGFAPIASPVLTGDPRAPTPVLGDADTSIATTKFVADTLSSTLSALPPPGATMSPGTPLAPTPLPGQLWFDTVGGQLYVRYDDGTSQQWVPATNIAGLANAATKQDVAAAMGNVGRNLIHNPMFNIAQRGVGPFTATGVYAADRWLPVITGDTASFVIVATGDAGRTQIGDEAYTSVLQNSFAGSAVATSYNQIVQRIEGVRRLSGKTVTVSFYAQAGAALKLGCNLYQFFGTGGSPSAGGWTQPTGAQFTLATTWQRYSATFVIPSANGKTLGTAGDDHTQLTFTYSCGATSNVILGNTGVQSGQIFLWGVQLEIGTVATPLEKPDPRYDLSNCQRFYFAFSGSMSTSGNASAVGYNDFSQVCFPTTMRAAPVIAGQTYSGGVNVAAQGWQNITPNKAEWYRTSGVAGGMGMILNSFTASADL